MTQAAAPAGPDGAEPPATIKVFDPYGRPVEIPREEWRSRILPGQFRRHWNDADGLAADVTQALKDGFAAEALEPARQLEKIDPDGVRAAILLAVTLLQLQRAREAKQVLETCIGRHGETGVVLTNLAKAEVALGDDAAATRLLDRAIELDPNQDNGLLWYALRERDRAGPQGWVAALRRAAARPDAWRPQLWLARDALEGRNPEAALALYADAFAHHAEPDGEMLMQVSGDLGNHGQLDAIIELVAPRFDAARHGLPVGNNLMKAYLDLGRPADARRILEELYRLQQPDWQQHLLWWEDQLDQAERKYGPLPAGEAPRISMLAFEAPVWASERLGLAALAPARPASGGSLVFVCGSGDAPSPGTAIVSQPADRLGRLTRALPLHFAEEAWHRTDATTSTLIPWMEQGGFVLSAREWTLDVLPGQRGGEGHAVFLHIAARGSPWRARLRIVRRADGAIVAEDDADLDPAAPAAGAQRLEDALFARLAALGIGVRAVPPGLEAPRGEWLPAFLVNTEQLLALRAALQDGVAAGFLHGERSIIDALVQNCAGQPENARFRLLLLAALGCEQRRRPDVAREYRDKLIELQRQHPIGGPLGAPLARAHEALLGLLAGA